LLQPSRAPAPSIAERLRTGAGRRALAIALALGIEGLLLLLLLLSGGIERPAPKEEVITVADLIAEPVAQEVPDPGWPEPAPAAPGQPRPEPPAQVPRPSEPAEPLPAQAAQPLPVPSPAPTAPATLPTPSAVPPPAAAPRSTPRPAAPTGRVYGPVDTGGSAAFRDTERVGTAPNGEPLYAAAWHREPRPSELRDYLSTARGPGWGLIACRTAPNYRVEACVPLDEYPAGSQINRALLAAAWEFEVRPPRRGGRLLVGSWVRIRIDYRTQQR
jgi:protein TonB